MEFGRFTFGSIEIDGTTYEHDLVIDRGRVRKRKKGPSKELRSGYGHTPLSAAEDIPWTCRRLVVGSGADGALPVMDQVADEARRRGVELVVQPTARALETLRAGSDDTNAILHVTC
ncbi:MAG TPA: MTH938/NDUFAF3 family protein [Actinomycetota bacterium]|nr:MTH938/NDUFAF3 family protein [Actinomycetota bacterium]